jgi:hypothetical protein
VTRVLLVVMSTTLFLQAEATASALSWPMALVTIVAALVGSVPAILAAFAAYKKGEENSAKLEVVHAVVNSNAAKAEEKANAVLAEFKRAAEEAAVGREAAAKAMGVLEGREKERAETSAKLVAFAEGKTQAEATAARPTPPVGGPGPGR